MTSQSKQPQQHDQPALRSKVVIRGAPPTLPEDILWTSLEPVVKLDTDIDWRSVSLRMEDCRADLLIQMADMTADGMDLGLIDPG